MPDSSRRQSGAGSTAFLRRDCSGTVTAWIPAFGEDGDERRSSRLANPVVGRRPSRQFARARPFASCRLATGRPDLMVCPEPNRTKLHALYRNRFLCGRQGSDGGGQCRDHAGAALARQGRAGHRQDRTGLPDRRCAGAAADPVDDQVDHQGGAGALRIRRGLAAARQPARRSEGQRHRQLHPPRQIVGGLRVGRARGAADRRDRQGRHRVPERSPAGARSDGVRRLRDRCGR